MSQIAPSEVDFWLDTDRYRDYIVDNPLDPSKKAISFSINLIRLASVRKAISNYVRILTRKSIPVYFNDMEVNRNMMGKIIYISADINTKADFDVAVGKALHEGAHSLLTDFDVILSAWANLPPNLLKKAGAKGIRLATFERFLHKIWNIVEDRYIDNYVFNRAPGYRGYYVALYNRYFHDVRIDVLLKSDEYRWPSLASYGFRICNLTNENSDLMALPRLDEIADVLNLDGIGSLTKTEDRVEVACEIVDIVLDCIDDKPTVSGPCKGKQQTMVTPDEFFGGGEDDSDSKDEESKEQMSDSDGEGQEREQEDPGTKMIKEISDILNNKPATPEENKDLVDKISENETPELKELQKELEEKQQQFLLGQLPNTPVEPAMKELLDLIDQHGIVLVRVGGGLLPGDQKHVKVDCIVVQKLTKELILKGQDVFPLSNAMRFGSDNPEPNKEVAEAVQKGINLGTKLGRRLQMRQEIHPVKFLRKKAGKLNKRQLHEVAWDADDVFYKVFIEKHNEATIHITVDASGSMAGEKWLRTMTAVVAMCKAASMIDNVHVTVSFRSTQTERSQTLPYVVLAYDSRIDKFSKVKSLFPYLEPNGLTPEGLAFEAIMHLFEGITPDEKDRYFLNLSDGEPYFHVITPEVSIAYMDEVGVSHTRAQVNRIRSKGVKILSYFIDGETKSFSPFLVNRSKLSTTQNVYSEQLRNNFQKMYGKNAKFINVNSIVELARTINQLFLSKLK